MHHQKRKTTEPTDNLSVISINYSKAPDKNRSPKECTEYRDEFNVSFSKLMGFSVLLFCRLFKFWEDFYHEFIHVGRCLGPLFQLPLCPPALAPRALWGSLLVWGRMSGVCIFGCGCPALCSLWFGGGSGHFKIVCLI
jgi:hypothetical protein